MAALRFLFLTLAAGVLGLLGWRAVAGRPDPVAPSPRPIAALEDAMRASPAATLPSLPAARPAAPSGAAGAADVPEFAGFYGRLKADFPLDAVKVEARLAPGTAPRPPDAAIWDALRDVEQSEGVLAAGADDATLDRFFDARSALLAGLAPVDARECADFLYGTADAGLTDFTAAHRPLVAALAGRTLDVITDGRARHIERAAPTPADLDALSAGLASVGLSRAEIGLLIDGTTMDPPLADGRLCEIGRTYLDVLHGLPADARGRIYGLAAELLARS